MAADLRGAGLEPVVQPADPSGESLHRVTVGRFSDYRAAREELDRLRGKGALAEGMVVP
jgi:cell division septation protein DedD